VPCAESPQLEAYFDGELDALDAAALERHAARCGECRAGLAELERVRSALRRDLPYESTPPELRARILQALEREGASPAPPPSPMSSAGWRTRLAASRRPGFWAGAVGGFGAAAFAAAAVFLLWTPVGGGVVLDELVNAHVRSLMPDHLIDVVSSDRHTVKPWFAGHADVSPVVADFAPAGYPLIGGRADYLEHQRAAVVVYQHGAHLINVFSWRRGAARSRLPRDASRSGYHIMCWAAGDLDYCALSDAGWEELQGLVRLLETLSAADSRAP
jgi:anti-sigma factor RsiW